MEKRYIVDTTNHVVRSSTGDHRELIAQHEQEIERVIGPIVDNEEQYLNRERKIEKPFTPVRMRTHHTKKEKPVHESIRYH